MPLEKAQCTNCGANIDINPSSGVCKCPFCGTQYMYEQGISASTKQSITSSRQIITTGQPPKEMFNDERFAESVRKRNIDEINKAKEVDPNREQHLADKIVHSVKRYITDHQSSTMYYDLKVNEDFSVVEYCGGTPSANFFSSSIKDHIKLYYFVEDIDFKLMVSHVESELKKLGLYSKGRIIPCSEPHYKEWGCMIVFYVDCLQDDNAQREVCMKKSKVTGNGCYIATCVYGSYDCPEVWVLRRYRDYTLSNNPFGRAFIKVYYAISPTLVRWFGDTRVFQTFWRTLLNMIVRSLKDKGVEDTRYYD